MSVSQAAAEFNKCDSDHGGQILFAEFCTWCAKRHLASDADEFGAEPAAAAEEGVPPAAASRPTLPKVMFGTAGLGNLYAEPPWAEKLAVVKAVVDSAGDGVAVFDSAGKYGAGLALEVLGQALEELGVAPEKVLISNKLAWKRVPLTTPEPTFEPGAWVNLKNDAVQDISYQGIMDCFENGNLLLGKYDSGLVSTPATRAAACG